MLHQHEFPFANYPDITDVAAIATGLGLLQSSLSFVNSGGQFWDSTAWDHFPQPFLDPKSTAYALALSAWLREQENPDWFRDLPSDVKRPAQKSLKFLCKSNDSFFNFSNEQNVKLDQPQAEWLEMAKQEGATTQVIAVKQLQADGKTNAEIEATLLEKIQSENLAIKLQCINAVERLKIADEVSGEDALIEELRLLIEHRDDEVRAKAMCALTRLKQLDEASVDVAARLLDGNARHIVFAGVYALVSQESVPDHVLPPVNRGFVRALQKCDYEFVGLFATAYNLWMDDPEEHVQTLLEKDGSEYVQIGLDALKEVQDQLVEIG